MKKSDWALIVLIVVITGLASYFIADAVLPAPNKEPQTVPTATAITSDVTEPPTTVFNSNAKNPSLVVTIGAGQQNPISENSSTTKNETSTGEE